MFQAMSRCQALHPDPEDEENVAEENEGDEEEDEEGMYGKLYFSSFLQKLQEINFTKFFFHFSTQNRIPASQCGKVWNLLYFHQ